MCPICLGLFQLECVNNKRHAGSGGDVGRDGGWQAWECVFIGDISSVTLWERRLRSITLQDFSLNNKINTFSLSIS